MIRTLTGTIQYLNDDYIVLDVNQVGYRVFMPTNQIEYLKSVTGEITVFTYLSVKEDSMLLFGFQSQEDLSVFEMLISVSGIGPKGAINILSLLTCEELKYAICVGDTKAISKASGIGRKTAEKCIIELKDKISIEDILDSANNSTSNKNNLPNISEAIEALTSLGYSNSHASNVIKNIDVNENTSVEEILKEALKYI